MRFPEDKIKEAILHPDLDVRDTAIRYFQSSTDRDATVMPLAIQAIEKYGRTNAFSHPHFLNDLPQTEPTLTWVIAELHRDFDAAAETKHLYFLNLSRLLCHAEVRLVAQREAEILHAPHFDPHERIAFRERFGMSELNAETCWNALLKYSEAIRYKNNIEEFDLGYAQRIVEALARQQHDYQAQIVAILSEPFRDADHAGRKWLQPFMAELAGEMRLQAAIPLLVRNLGHPWSFLSDQSMFALAKIGSDDVVTAVCDQFPRASKDFRLYASDLLCKIHLDVTVQLLLGLLPGVTELNIRMNLCEALIDHFSLEGIEPTRQFIKQNGLTPDLRRLRSTLITTCTIMEIRFPEYFVWQAEAKNDAQRERTVNSEFLKVCYESRGDQNLLIEKLKALTAEKQLATKKLKAKIAEKPLTIKQMEAEIAENKKHLAAETAPRAVPALPKNRENRPDSSSPSQPNRVGRNDRCPCGSGKKFKTCCLRK